MKAVTFICDVCNKGHHSKTDKSPQGWFDTGSVGSRIFSEDLYEALFNTGATGCDHAFLCPDCYDVYCETTNAIDKAVDKLNAAGIQKILARQQKDMWFTQQLTGE